MAKCGSSGCNEEATVTFLSTGGKVNRKLCEDHAAHACPHGRDAFSEDCSQCPEVKVESEEKFIARTRGRGW